MLILRAALVGLFAALVATGLAFANGGPRVMNLVLALVAAAGFSELLRWRFKRRS